MCCKFIDGCGNGVWGSRRTKVQRCERRPEESTGIVLIGND
jgi:hypothetical protein